MSASEKNKGIAVMHGSSSNFPIQISGRWKQILMSESEKFNGQVFPANKCDKLNKLLWAVSSLTLNLFSKEQYISRSRMSNKS